MLKEENLSSSVASVLSTGAWKCNSCPQRAPIYSLEKAGSHTSRTQGVQSGTMEMPGVRSCSSVLLPPSQSFSASSSISSEFVKCQTQNHISKQTNLKKNSPHCCYHYQGRQQIFLYKQFFKRGPGIQRMLGLI